jgi:hypothetical protein
MRKRFGALGVWRQPSRPVPYLRWRAAAETAFGFLQRFGNQECWRLARSRGHGLLRIATRGRRLCARQLLRQDRVIGFTTFQAELRVGFVPSNPNQRHARQQSSTRCAAACPMQDRLEPLHTNECPNPGRHTGEGRYPGCFSGFRPKPCRNDGFDDGRFTGWRCT